jgi:hypothetical protein
MLPYGATIVLAEGPSHAMSLAGERQLSTHCGHYGSGSFRPIVLKNSRLQR